jgi:rfaE bifunctional protein nucleotidyltransferase chain/domain
MTADLFPKEKTLEELEELVQHLQRQGKSIVWTNGFFEILHAGHIEFLLKAAKLGDVFIVGVNSDASVRAQKGAGHPLVPERERVLVLSAVQCVDYVTVFDDLTSTRILQRLRPQVYAKGFGHVHGDIHPEERSVVETQGGCIALIGGDPGKSTGAIVARIRKG